jgi:hypothetical protein
LTVNASIKCSPTGIAKTLIGRAWEAVSTAFAIS